MDRIAVVGAGLAGFAAAQELRRLGYSGALTLVGAEPHLPYRRPPLSKGYLLGESGDLTVPGADDLEATWLLGHVATGLDVRRRRVLRGGDPPVGFDGLVIATGVRARTLALTRNMPGLLVLRQLDDARALRAALSHRPRVVIAGAGFVGSEVAATLSAMDLPVTLVEPDSVPLRRPLGEEIGGYVADLHREHGVDLRLGRRVTTVSGAGRVERVLLDDGTVLPADLLVVALGAEPQVDWLRDSGLHLDGGVVLGSDGLALTADQRATVPDVTAAGDVARWPHPLLGGELVRVEHYSNALEQGEYAARALLGGVAGFAPVPSFWCHLYNRRIQSVGFTGVGYEMHMASRDGTGRFLAEYRREGRLVGAATAGFLRELPRYRRLISDLAA